MVFSPQGSAKYADGLPTEPELWSRIDSTLRFAEQLAAQSYNSPKPKNQTTKGDRIQILATCPTKIISFCLHCPSIRGCPKCGILIEHENVFKHVSCRNCHSWFCFICLKEVKDRNWQLHYNVICKLAPRQSTLPRTAEAQD